MTNRIGQPGKYAGRTKNLYDGWVAASSEATVLSLPKDWRWRKGNVFAIACPQENAATRRSFGNCTARMAVARLRQNELKNCGTAVPAVARAG